MSEIFNSIQVSDEVNRFVDHSFDVVNKIHSILERQGKTQRDLSVMLGKSESEISKWMRGTHNFTLKSISKIEAALGEKIFIVTKEDEMVVKKEIINHYTSLLKSLKFTFEKEQIIERSKANPSNYFYKEIKGGVNENNGNIDVSSDKEPEESSKYAMAA